MSDSYMVVGRGSTRGRRRGPSGPAIRMDVAVAMAITWEGPAGALEGPGNLTQEAEDPNRRARRAITWEGPQDEEGEQPIVPLKADEPAEATGPQVKQYSPQGN